MLSGYFGKRSIQELVNIVRHVATKNVTQNVTQKACMLPKNLCKILVLLTKL